MPLASMAPLADPAWTLFSVQKEMREIDRPALEVGWVRWLGPDITDFADTAAIVELADLVVTVDTSIAHLAGAMGKPLWVLLTFAPDWRWFLGRDDSPWYPTARLFRQERPGAWEEVIERVRHELLRTLNATIPAEGS
jgi:hypothetical protein